MPEVKPEPDGYCSSCFKRFVNHKMDDCCDHCGKPILPVVYTNTLKYAPDVTDLVVNGAKDPAGSLILIW